MNREHHLSVAELGLRLRHKSRLALLVLPLFTPGHPDPTPDFAREFADAFNLVILQEGKQAFNFINDLKEQERGKIISILSLGGMEGTIYISDEDIFSVSSEPSK